MSVERHIIRNVQVWDSAQQQTVVIDLDMAIDLRWIAQLLAGKAYNNKARKSQALNGLIEVSMRGTKVTPLAAMAKPVSAMVKA